MSSRIHPSAIIHPTAVLGDNVDVGPFVVVGPNVFVGDGTKLLPHCHIVSNTTLGKDCQICSSAVVGGDPQDLKFRGEATYLEIGNRTRIGEFATVNRGTGIGGGATAVGDDCMIMAYVHIAHDCVVGNNVVITNLTQLAGHIHIEDHAWISGSCLIHHFVTIGSMSFVAPGSGISFDVPPYMLVEGFRDTCRVRNLNMQGLKRRQVPEESISALRKAFKLIFRQEGSSTQDERIQELETSELIVDSYVSNFANHLKATAAGVSNRALERYRQDRAPQTQVYRTGDTRVVGEP